MMYGHEKSHSAQRYPLDRHAPAGQYFSVIKCLPCSEA